MIFYSKHSREKMIERGISVNEIEDGLKRGAKELQYPDKILFHYRYFTILTRKIKTDYYIITVKPR